MSIYPPILYHYTSNRALLGMLQSGELWFTDIRCLNDAREFHQAGHIIANTIQRTAPKFRTTWLEHGCKPEAFDGMVHNMIETFRNVSYAGGDGQTDTARFPPLVFCMSSDGDSLSQWRAYGNGEFCIGFNTDSLIRIVQDNVLKVEYMGLHDNLEDMNHILNEFFRGHLERMSGFYDGEVDAETFYDGMEYVKENFRKENLYIKIKDKSFREENEWRLVKYINPRDESIFLDAKGRYPVLRAKVRFIENPRQLGDIISDIKCGPEIDEARMERLAEMVNSHLDTRIQFSYSMIPYISDT